MIPAVSLVKSRNKSKKSIRLGGGEFEAAGSEARLAYEGARVGAVTASTAPQSVQHARLLFLNAAAELEASILESLRAGPYQALLTVSKPGRLLFDWRHVENVVELRGLRNSLKKWAARWYLIDPWCLEWALQTISMWSLNPNFRGWFHNAIAVGRLETENLTVDLGRWDPSRESRDGFEAKAKAWFEHALKEYCDAVEAQSIGAGLKRTPEKRSREHFAWLARFQIRGEKPADIWRFHPVRHHGSRRAVEKAIKDLAQFIGLTLRDRPI